jgi:hypothetical protein
MNDEPIQVEHSAAASMVASNCRVFLVAFGAFVAGKGWLSEDEYAQYLPAAVIVIPWVWGQVSGFIKHRRFVVTAAAAPNDVAVVK